MQFYYIHTDHQGSVIAITDAEGDFVFQATYDAWGRQTVTKNDIAFFRGYTGHEMLNEYGLINMNGRLYDPCIGRFLSPDNYVQQPTNSQNFNRYSYCLNNPLKYTDPSGELFGVDDIVSTVIMAYIGGVLANINHSSQNCSNPFNPLGWKWNSASTYIGIISGGLNGAGISLNVPGIITNGALHSSMNIAINGINNIVEGEDFFSNWGWAAFVGFAEGAYSGYGIAKEKGKNFWWGNSVKYNRKQWSFINSDKPDYTIIMMKSDPIIIKENDCMISTMAEVEKETGGTRSYGDFFKMLEKKYSNHGVSMTIKEYNQILDDNFSKQSIKPHLIFDPDYMKEVAYSNNVISIHFTKPGHSDNVRKLKVFINAPEKNKLVFRQSMFNVNYLNFYTQNHPFLINRLAPK